MDVYDLVGSFAGKELSAALQRIGAPDCGRMVLLNDTVATLFSGLPMVNSSVLEKDRAAFLGFVLGTGCNIACKNPSTGRVTVLESGNYHGGFVSSLDEDFDAQLKDPGKYALEKATAGAYLGPLSLLAIQKALESDCLQVAQPEKLMALSTLDTKTLNAFLRRDLDAASPFIQLIGSDESAQAVRYLCTILARRSALIAALGLCSCVDFIRQNQEVEAVNIAVDGSTWRLYHGIRENMEAWLRSFLQDSGPVELSLVAPDRASLIGAALASQSIEAQHF
jgi:hexokinase